MDGFLLVLNFEVCDHLSLEVDYDVFQSLPCDCYA